MPVLKANPKTVRHNMSSIIQAILEHDQSSEQILLLPDKLKQLGIILGEWTWPTTSINKAFLLDYWEKTPEDFIKMGSFSEENLAILRNQHFSLHFFQPKLVAFDSLLNQSVYSANAAAKNDFDRIVQQIAILLEASDAIILPDHYDYYAYDPNEPLTVQQIRQGVKEKGLGVFEIK